MRRTRKYIYGALTDLTNEKPFTAISVTDITKKADIARVTFYQHFESKEAVLLALVSDFFEQLYAAIDLETIRHYLETGDADSLGLNGTHVAPPASSDELRLVKIALKQVGSQVRALAVASFMCTYAELFPNRPKKALQVVATYHVAGVLALLESLLDGDIMLSPQSFGTLTMLLMREHFASMHDGSELVQLIDGVA